VIIGNGVAGTTAAFTIQQRELDAETTVIRGEPPWFDSESARTLSSPFYQELPSLIDSSKSVGTLAFGGVVLRTSAAV
jgi:thioredoxin reductase